MSGTLSTGSSSSHSQDLFPLPWSTDHSRFCGSSEGRGVWGRAPLMKDISTKNCWSTDQQFFVEIPGFEPGQTEPKSVVLPLHHISIPGCKDIIFFILVQITDQNNTKLNPEAGVLGDKCLRDKGLVMGGIRVQLTLKGGRTRIRERLT